METGKGKRIESQRTNNEETGNKQKRIKIEKEIVRE